MLSQAFRGHFQQQWPGATQGHFLPLPPRPAAVPLGFDFYRSSWNTILPGSECLQQGEGIWTEKSGFRWTQTPPCPGQPPEGPASPAWASTAAPARSAAPGAHGDSSFCDTRPWNFVFIVYLPGSLALPPVAVTITKPWGWRSILDFSWVNGRRWQVLFSYLSPKESPY